MTSGNVVNDYEQRYTIMAGPSGNRLICSEDVKLPFGIPSKVVGLFQRSISEAHLERMLVKLKSLVET